jgi:hypothetical protein
LNLQFALNNINGVVYYKVLVLIINIFMGLLNLNNLFDRPQEKIVPPPPEKALCSVEDLRDSLCQIIQFKPAPDWLLAKIDEQINYLLKGDVSDVDEAFKLAGFDSIRRSMVENLIIDYRKKHNLMGKSLWERRN